MAVAPSAYRGISLWAFADLSAPCLLPLNSAQSTGSEQAVEALQAVLEKLKEGELGDADKWGDPKTLSPAVDGE